MNSAALFGIADQPVPGREVPLGKCPEGGHRSQQGEETAALAGKSTLNRLEHGAAEADRYRRIAHDGAAIEALFVDLFLDAHAQAPTQIVLDLDATDDPLHGHQGGQF